MQTIVSTGRACYEKAAKITLDMGPLVLESAEAAIALLLEGSWAGLNDHRTGVVRGPGPDSQ